MNTKFLIIKTDFSNKNKFIPNFVTLCDFIYVCCYIEKVYQKISLNMSRSISYILSFSKYLYTRLRIMEDDFIFIRLQDMFKMFFFNFWQQNFLKVNPLYISINHQASPL